nr:MAG TPA: hypothetical protein [Caudoviricetes sp.]
MAKYKVGDKVRIVSERPASPRFVNSMVQYLGKTLTVSKVEEETLGAIYRFKEATYPAYFTPIAKSFFPNANGMWTFCEDWIAGLAEPEKPTNDGLSVVIRFHGRLTVAELYKNGKMIKVDNARCNPKDEYSRAEGAKIAVERLFKKTSGKPKIGDKFVVVGRSDDMRHAFDIGTIVTLVCLQDDGYSGYRDNFGVWQFVSDRDVKPYKENAK